MSGLGAARPNGTAAPGNTAPRSTPIRGFTASTGAALASAVDRAKTAAAPARQLRRTRALTPARKTQRDDSGAELGGATGGRPRCWPALRQAAVDLVLG